MEEICVYVRRDQARKAFKSMESVETYEMRRKVRYVIDLSLGLVNLPSGALLVWGGLARHREGKVGK